MDYLQRRRELVLAQLTELCLDLRWVAERVEEVGWERVSVTVRDGRLLTLAGWLRGGNQILENLLENWEDGK